MNVCITLNACMRSCVVTFYTMLVQAAPTLYTSFAPGVNCIALTLLNGSVELYADHL